MIPGTWYCFLKVPHFSHFVFFIQQSGRLFGNFGPPLQARSRRFGPSRTTHDSRLTNRESVVGLTSTLCAGPHCYSGSYNLRLAVIFSGRVSLLPGYQLTAPSLIGEPDTYHSSSSSSSSSSEFAVDHRRTQQDSSEQLYCC